MRKVLIFIFSCSLALAGPWEDFVEARRKSPGARGRWTLVVKPSLLSPKDLLADAEYQRLSSGGDWGLESLSGPAVQDLQATHGAQWALLSPKGDVAGTGQGAPKGEKLLEILHASGAKARFELRDQFLRDNPDQGEARMEALNQELRMLRARVATLDNQGKVKVPAWHPEPGAPVSDERITLAGADALAEELYAPVCEALRRLAQVPHWTSESYSIASRIVMFKLGQSASMQRLFAKVAPELEDQAAADPEDAGVLKLWMEALDGAGLLPESLSGKVQAVPGSVWPTAQMLPSLTEPYRRTRNWEGELKLLADLTPEGPPQPLTQGAWDDYCGLQGALLAHRALVAANQGSWDQARAHLDAAVAWGGPRAVHLTLMRRGALDPGADAIAWRRLLGQVVSHQGNPPAMPAQAPPLRLTLLGRPGWLLAWTELREAPELSSWAPGELRWDIATPETHARCRAQYGWDAEPRWALFQGEELLATGEALPAPRALAAALALHGTPMLERMANVLGRNPRHLATRRARFTLLQTRMPDARLEPLMAEDAASALMALPFAPGEGWKPDEAIWGAHAQIVLPELETRLRSWPSDTALWTAWISWSRFHPSHPSILTLAQSLPYWTPAGDWRTGLPYTVQRAVAGELRRQGRFLEMKEWFQSAWDQLDHRPMKDLRPWEKQWLGQRRAEEETAVFQPLRDALRGLGLHEQQLELERTFGAMMGKDLSRSK